MIQSRLSHIPQHERMDCGPVALLTVFRYYGLKKIKLNTLKGITDLQRDGVSLRELKRIAEEFGFGATIVKASIADLEKEQHPCIILWGSNHFVVVDKVGKSTVTFCDPAQGICKVNTTEFMAGFAQEEDIGYALLLEFNPMEAPVNLVHHYPTLDKSLNLLNFFTNLLKFKRQMFQVFIGLLIATCITFMMPFLTQAIIDTGVQNQDLKFIIVILVAQMVLFLGQSIVDYLKALVIAIVSGNLGMDYVNRFVKKALSLPIRYFELRSIGDFLQQLHDNERVQQFVTKTTTSLVFSGITLFLFGGILLIMNAMLFYIFLFGTSVYVGWILFFLRYRKQLDILRFAQLSRSQAHIIRTFEGITDIKLSNAEPQFREEWEDIQYDVLGTKVNGAKLDQVQELGAKFINQSKNALITFISAKLLVSGDISFGGLMAIQFINGQLNIPIQDIIVFIRSLQDAKLSVSRLNQVYETPPEETASIDKLKTITGSNTLSMENVSFGYNRDVQVVSDLNIEIQAGKVTAIVGSSGSGKSTILKLLLQNYRPTSGVIKLGNHDLSHVDIKAWRAKCGVVLQGGRIFDMSIAENIAIGNDEIDIDQLMMAARTANILEFVMSLPLGFETQVGPNFNLSEGQKQRILIARAVYKSPEYFFFDEATNSLDSVNESKIVANLKHHFKNKTVVIIAHRLSTISDADKIIVINHGCVAEQGTHSELLLKNGLYSELIANQVDVLV